MKFSFNKVSLRWIAGLALIGVAFAPFAWELHLLVHNHGAEHGIHESHGAVDSVARGETQQAGNSSSGTDSFSAANAQVAFDCYFGNSPSQRVAAIVERGNRAFTPLSELSRFDYFRAEYTRLSTPRRSRGPPLNA